MVASEAAQTSLKPLHWVQTEFFIARPFVTAVYGGKADGVRAYIDKIGTELEDTMKMCGVSSLDEITRDCVMTF